MNALALDPTSVPPGHPGRSGGPSPLARLASRAWAGDRTLVVFGLALALVAAAGLVGIGLDPRELRGVNVWVKPVKFSLSLAVLAWTTALFAGFLDPAFRRRSRSLDALRAVFLFAATFEIVYIAVQAALGQGSHFNVGDPFHATMYSLMGVGAMALAATQPWLAVHLRRHAAAGVHPALREAMVAGLWLSFVLGASAGALMSGLAAPLNGGLPVLGWTFGTGDLRPAHFVGMHAAQVLPLAAAAAIAWRPARASALVRGVALFWATLFVAAVAGAFVGLGSLLA